MKIGLGCITHGREEYFKKVLEGIVNSMEVLDYVVIVNDGTPYSVDIPDGIEHIQLEAPLGVGHAKNIAFQNLLDNQCDYIFLSEDDVVIKDPAVFEKYIETSENTGMEHLIFAYPERVGILGPSFSIDFNGILCEIHPQSPGTFCFYTANCLKTIGLMNERFYNAMEHVEHTYRACLAEFCPPFWAFPDIASSHLFIENVEKEVKSTLLDRAEHQSNLELGKRIFKDIYGHVPEDILMPTPEELQEYFDKKDSKVTTNK